MRKVKEEKPFLTEKSKEIFPEVDFSDTFSTTNNTNTIEEIANLIFNYSPKWLRFLFEVRNKMVKVFGLKSTKPEDYNEDFKVGGYLQFFKIDYISDNEVILGADDAHLNFRAIIYKTTAKTYNIKVTTLVKFNHSGGKIYMNIIKPFHRLVIIRMIKNAYAS